MVESVGPIVRPTPVDPLKTDTWPMACALAWIRALARNWTSEQCDRLIRESYRQEAEAFPAGDPPLEEGRRLLDYAAAHPEDLTLHYDGGVIDPSALGPDAVVLPTITGSRRNTFGIWPKPQVDIGARFLGVWCIAHQVKAAWPWMSDAASKPAPRGDAEVLKIAFDACYPNGVPRGTKRQEVYNKMAAWIVRERDRRAAPTRKTFDRHRTKFWQDRSDT